MLGGERGRELKGRFHLSSGGNSPETNTQGGVGGGGGVSGEGRDEGVASECYLFVKVYAVSLSPSTCFPFL